jgi:carnitine O-palmitoyltransferase 1
MQHVHAAALCRYESATTRFFLNGRTETIRSATPDSCQFVDAVRDKTEKPVDTATAGTLLRKAIRTHVQTAKAAGMGEGCDRHLFGLMMAAKEKGKRVPFLENPALRLPFALSTSQTACKLSVAGGFGPVYPCGYGVSYFVQEDHIMFTVACFSGNQHTSSARYIDHVIAAMQLQKQLLTDSSQKQ